MILLITYECMSYLYSVYYNVLNCEVIKVFLTKCIKYLVWNIVFNNIQVIYYQTVTAVVIIKIIIENGK